MEYIHTANTWIDRDEQRRWMKQHSLSRSKKAMLSSLKRVGTEQHFLGWVVFSYSLHPFFLVFMTSKIVKICTNKFVPTTKKWRVTLSSRSCKGYSRTRPSPMWRTAASDPYISTKYKTNCLGGGGHYAKKTIKCPAPASQNLLPWFFLSNC
jgi:hypothetical protein